MFCFISAVNNALATSPHDHLDANELITRILEKLRPFVEEALRKEVLAQKPEFTEDDIVKEVEEALEPTIISVISGAVRNSKDKSLFSDKASQEKLGEFSTIFDQYISCAIICTAHVKLNNIISFIQSKPLSVNSNRLYFKQYKELLMYTTPMDLMPRT